MTTITGAGPSITESDIKHLEATLKVKLPPQYKEFMLKHNGGFPQPYNFRFKDQPTQGSALECIYMICPGGKLDIISPNNQRKGKFPTKFISIGRDHNGNAICLSCREGDTYGKTYFWDHNREADKNKGESPDDMRNVRLIANDFDSLLSGLIHIENPEISSGAVVDDNAPGMQEISDRLKKSSELSD